MNIEDFKHSLPTVVRTDTIANNVESAKQTLGQLFNSIDKIPTRVKMSVDTDVMRRTTTSHSSVLTLLSGRLMQANIVNNLNYVATLLNDMPDKMAGREASVKTVAVIATAELSSVLSAWTSTYLIEAAKAQGASKSNSTAYQPNQPNINRLTKEASMYAIALNYYTQAPAKFIKTFDLPDLNVTKYNGKQLRASGVATGQTPVAYLTSNFIGNPIYHIRMYITDIQVWWYKILRDEAQQLELLLLTLQADRANQKSPGVEREIEITEERIARARRRMNMIAEDDGYV